MLSICEEEVLQALKVTSACLGRRASQHSLPPAWLVWKAETSAQTCWKLRVLCWSSGKRQRSAREGRQAEEHARLRGRIWRGAPSAPGVNTSRGLISHFSLMPLLSEV